MAKTLVAPDLHGIWDVFAARIPELQSRNFQVTLAPFGTSTIGGERGVRLEATRDGVTYAISVEIAVDAMRTTTILVDGQLNPIAPNAMTKPRDIEGEVGRVAAWFVTHYVPA